MRIRYFIGCVVFACAAFVGSAARAASPDLAAMSLRADDLPSGFAEANHRFWTPQQLGAEGPWTLAQLKAWGYLRGYEIKFTRSVESGRPGQITSAVGSYGSSAGAAKALAANLVECRKGPWKRLTLRVRIGDRGYLCRRTANVEGTPVELHFIVWRIGRLKGSVTVTNVVGQLGAPEAVLLGLVQARRMRCMHRRPRVGAC